MNEAKSLGDVFVFDEFDIGRASFDDVDRLDEKMARRRRFSFHHLIERLRGEISAFLRVERDARERRRTEFAEEFVRVDADDGKLFRRVDPR